MFIYNIGNEHLTTKGVGWGRGGGYDFIGNEHLTTKGVGWGRGGGYDFVFNFCCHILMEKYLDLKDAENKQSDVILFNRKY